jgi:RNA polymerase sigma-70 factor (ECF subfamily)
MTSDEVLMLEFQRGSREAFEELFARYREPLYGFFRRRLGGRERAEDLAQETFLAVIRATSRYEPRAFVRTYLYAIALKLLAAERRKRFDSAPTGLPDPEPAIDGAS